MNATRSKKLRFTMTAIAAKFGDDVKRACQDKLAMMNVHGKPQHRRINPKRQLKKMILREKLA